MLKRMTGDKCPKPTSQSGVLLPLCKEWPLRNSWMAQSVEYPTLDFGSGHDLMVHGIKPHQALCQALSVSEFSLSPSLCPSLTCACSFSLKINKLRKKKKSDHPKPSAVADVMWLVLNTCLACELRLAEWHVGDHMKFSESPELTVCLQKT